MEGGFGIHDTAADEPEAVFYDRELVLLCATTFPASGTGGRLLVADTREWPFPVTMLGEASGG